MVHDIYKAIQFYESQTLIQFLKKYREFIGDERINAIYTFDPKTWSTYIPSRKIYDTQSPIIIEFDSIAVKIDYFFFSDLSIHIIDKESFYKGEWTSELLGWHQVPSDQFPYEKDEDMSHLEGQPITEFIVERFSDEFEIDGSTGCVRPAGGDYFASVYLMLGNTGFRICGNDSMADGSMEYEIVSRDNISSGNCLFESTYESIRMN